jgi:hypothetical protein
MGMSEAEQARREALAAGQRASAAAFRHNRWPSEETRAAMEEAERAAIAAGERYRRLRGPVDREGLYG